VGTVHVPVEIFTCQVTRENENWKGLDKSLIPIEAPEKRGAIKGGRQNAECGGLHRRTFARHAIQNAIHRRCDLTRTKFKLGNKVENEKGRHLRF